MRSPQTLSETERRTLAAWAADCAERVLPIFEAEAPRDDRPRDAIARARAFARGDLGAAELIRLRFEPLHRPRELLTWARTRWAPRRTLPRPRGSSRPTARRRSPPSCDGSWQS